MLTLIFDLVKACTQEMFVEPLEERGFLPMGQGLMETDNATERTWFPWRFCETVFERLANSHTMIFS